MENTKIMVQNRMSAIVYARKAKALQGVMEHLKQFDKKVVNASLETKLEKIMNVGYKDGKHLENQWKLESIYYRKENGIWSSDHDRYKLTIRVKNEYGKYETYRGDISTVGADDYAISSEINLVVEEKRLNYEETAKQIQSMIDKCYEKVEELSFDSRTVEEFAELFMQLDKQVEKLKEEASYEVRKVIKEMYSRNLHNIDVLGWVR